MDDESHSTSQDSSNSREAVQINIGVAIHDVNFPEAHCVLFRRIYSPGNEGNWHDNLNICQDFEVLRHEPYDASLRAFRCNRTLRRSRKRYCRISRRQRYYRQDVMEARQVVEEAWHSAAEAQHNVVEVWQVVEEARQDVAEARQLLEEAQQDLEEARHHVEQDPQHLRRLHEEHAYVSNYRGEATLSPTTLSFVESLPHIIITEEHEKKHDGLVCAICTNPLSVGTIGIQLPCLHFFHPLCIAPWLKVKGSCPTCRYKLSSASRNEMRQNTNRRMGFQESIQEGLSVNRSAAPSTVNEPEVLMSVSRNETTYSLVRLNVNSSSATSNVNEPEVAVSVSDNETTDI